MIKLYGLRMSNYYSLTKALLIEKALDFEEVKKAPSQKEDFLMLSPMGKMPAIEVDGFAPRRCDARSQGYGAGLSSQVRC